ncbi:hypothetical protein PMG11_00686 [Penicillium brasilianum]|uniref:Uncharacterized protein n=1 Tax=Penicillium brasilianum TaxID=104259 RepID=A0A0F7TCC8_PENBI|nr:hypothetical protein PMG11_00686 [Penicillium brasilianum]
MSIILDSPAAQHDFCRGSHWYHESPFLPIGETRGNEPGASSLKDMATRCLVMDQSALKLELFENVPWKIAKELWEFLGNRGKQTLLMWKILIMRYPEQFPQLSPTYCMRTKVPKTPLKGYIDNVRSDACHWRAALSLSSAYASVSDLVEIGNLKNLVALEIHSRVCDPSLPTNIETRDGAQLDDGVVRSWLDAAQSTGSLQNLQVLRIYQQNSLTHHILWMLEKLPGLKLIVIYQCGKLTQEFSHLKARTKYGVQIAGWNAQRLDWVPDGGKTDAFKYLRPLLKVYEDGLSFRDTESKPNSPMLHSNMPIMEFGLPAYDCDDSEKEKRRAAYAAKSIFILTRATGLNGRKRAPQEIQQPRNTGKRIMKERGGRDMADVLGDFFGI